MNREELKESLGEELCSYCPWTNGEIEQLPYGICEGCYCDEALDNFMDINERYFDEPDD